MGEVIDTTQVLAEDLGLPWVISYPGQILVVVATAGAVNDWAAYADVSTKSIQDIVDYGDKLTAEQGEWLFPDINRK